MNIFASTWALLAAGLLFALPMIHLRVKDHTDLEDETMCVLFSQSSPLSLTLNASARMDDFGHILPAEQMETHSPTKAEA